jgi:hypothetical protein
MVSVRFSRQSHVLVGFLMPIDYSIDRERGIIFETWTGDITAADLGAYWQRYLADPEVMALRRTLVDLRPCRILFNGQELSDLVSGVVIPILKGRDWKTAIVVEHPTQYGVCRQYQVFAENYSQDSIFHEPEEALAWLLARVP